MKLIDEIIDVLSYEEKKGLTNALLKTKVLLHRLGEHQSVNWVNMELNGYPDENVPEYRIIQSAALGNITNGAWYYKSQTLPLMHLEDDIREYFDKSRIGQSVAVLESFPPNEKLSRKVAPEFYSLLSQSFGGGYEIQHAWVEISAGSIEQILTQIRSRLLDFVLLLSDKFPDEIGVDKLRDKSIEYRVSEMFSNTVFGDNTTIVLGDAVNSNIISSIVKNDIETLKDALRENNVSEPDIDELIVAIEADDHRQVKSHGFGENVSNWIGGMVAKAASTAWDVKVGVASSLLATALTNYYGA
jgi:hypothetical protein